MAKRPWRVSKPSSSDVARKPPAKSAPQFGRGRQTASSRLRTKASMVKVLLSVFGIVVLATIAVVLWPHFVPVQPTVVIITAEHNQHWLTPNAFAKADAQTLAAQCDVLPTQDVVLFPTDQDELRDAVEFIARSGGSGDWFAKGKAPVIAYVNAIGFSVWDSGRNQADARILPAGVELPQSPDDLHDVGVPVAALIDAVNQSSADWKVLVLDCQRQDDCWPLGTLQNDFVSVVQAYLETHKSRWSNLYVLFSCAPNELTCVDYENGRSVFGWFFAQGLYANRSDDFDQKLTLAELNDHVRTNVEKWSHKHRRTKQTPTLVYFGQDPANVQLLAIPSGASFRAESENAEKSAQGRQRDGEKQPFLATLRDAWSVYDAQLPKGRFLSHPHQWRSAETSLLCAERLWLAGREQAAARELDLAVAELGRLQRPSKTSPGCSLAMDRYLGVGRPQITEAVAKFADGQWTHAETVAQINSSASKDPLPVEALLTAMLRNRPSTIDRPERLKDARAMVKQRLDAETVAAFGESALSAQLAYHLGRVVERADANRRLAEDQQFCQADRVVVGAPSAERRKTIESAAAQRGVSLGQPATQDYATASDLTAELESAISLWGRLMSESPHLTELLIARTWCWSDELRDQTATLLQQAVQLDALLRKPPELDDARLKSHIDQVRKLRESAGATRESLLRRLLDEALQLGQSTARPEDAEQWRAMDHLLRSPFLIPDDKPAEVTPQELALTRVQLLQRYRQLPERSSEDAPSSLAADKEFRQKFVAVHRLLQLADGQPSPANYADTDQAGFQLAQRFYGMYQSPEGSAEQRLQREDAALRLRPVLPSLATVSDAPTRWTRWLRGRFLVWHARRCMQDFWGPPEGGEAYFYTAAKHYLTLASDVCSDLPEFSAVIQQATQELERLKDVAPELGVSPKQTTLLGVFDTQAIQFSVSGEDIPPGIGALESNWDPKLQRRMIDEPAPLGTYHIGMKSLTEGSASVRSRCWYRGRQYWLEAAVRMINDETGPTVTYRNELKDPPAIRVHLSGGTQSYAKILLVLDCSSSMNKGGRMNRMRDVLRRFSDMVEGTGVEIGIRLFGNNVAATEPAAKAEFDTQNVLAVGRFDRNRFDRILTEQARPTGWTPLFRALESAAKDFQSVEGKEKRMIVVSDGGDNWYNDDFRSIDSGLQLLKNAYANVDVSIDTIGFELDQQDRALASTQLQRIAQQHKGRYTEARNAEELLERVAGLAGTFYLTATGRARSFSSETIKIEQHERSIIVPPGQFDLEVRDSKGARRANLENVRLHTGEVHRLQFTPPDAFGYVENDFPGARARTDQGSFALRVLEAVATPGGLQLEFALFDHTRPDWRPEGMKSQILATDRTGGEWVYAFHHRAPNSGGHHLPHWRIELQPWPRDVATATLNVGWSQAGQRGTTVGFSEWKSAKLSDQVRIIHAGRAADSDEWIVKFHFPSELRSEMQSWSVRFDDPVRFAKEIWNPEHGVYSGYFRFEPNQVRKFVVQSPAKSEPAQTLSLPFQVKSRGF